MKSPAAGLCFDHKAHVTADLLLGHDVHVTADLLLGHDVHVTADLLLGHEVIFSHEIIYFQSPEWFVNGVGFEFYVKWVQNVKTVILQIICAMPEI